MIGQIKITFTEKGNPEVTILGDIPARQYNSLPIHLRRAVRAHRAALRRASGKPDMSDKGAKIADLNKAEMDSMNVPNPQAGADELNITVTPPPDFNVNDFKQAGPAKEEEANESKPETEIEDGANEGTADIRRNDEGQGSKKSPSWKQ